MNLAVNGLRRGKSKKANTYYEDSLVVLERSTTSLANPPFNVDDVSLKQRGERQTLQHVLAFPPQKKKKPRGKKKDAGKETVPNANYLWINLFLRLH